MENNAARGSFTEAGREGEEVRRGADVKDAGADAKAKRVREENALRRRLEVFKL